VLSVRLSYAPSAPKKFVLRKVCAEGSVCVGLCRRVCVERFVSGEFVLGWVIDIAVLRCMRIVRHSSSHQYLAERFVSVVV
jgi:hypothetical protein